MEDSLSINQLLDRFRAIDSFSIKKAKWPFPFSPIFNDYVSTIYLNGKKVEGRGVSLSRDEAIIKSLGELAERSSCRMAHMSSTGAAAHSKIELAEKNSLHELVERDALMYSYITDAPFYSLTMNMPIKDVDEYLIEVGIKYEFIRLVSLEGYIVLMLVFRGANSLEVPFGRFFSVSCSPTIEEAVIKCMCDGLRVLSGIHNFPEITERRNGFSKTLNLEMYRMYDFFFEKKIVDSDSLELFPHKNSYSHESIRPAFSLPFKVVKAYSEDLQEFSKDTSKLLISKSIYQRVKLFEHSFNW